MADFALWATACEGMVWGEGVFARAYTGNRDKAVDSVIEADPVGSAVRSLMETRTEWTGTASDLLGALSDQVGDTVRRSKTWPTTPRTVAGRLRRAATFLRKVGVDTSFDREGRARTRTIRISCPSEDAVISSSAPSAPSADRGNGAGNNGFDDMPLRTVTQDADANDPSTDSPIVRKNPCKTGDADDADDADAKIPPDSGGWGERV